MKPLKSLRALCNKTVIILVLCGLFLLGLLHYRMWDKKQDLSDITCRAEFMIKNNDAAFKGVLDLKSGAGKGIANLTGIVSSAAGKEYHLQRTVLYSLVIYGISPVWTSNQIIVSDTENVPEDLLLKVLPAFYLQPAKVTDADAIYLNSQAWLVTKSSIPYIYCKKYQLTNAG